MRTQLLRLMANGWAAFLDFSIGVAVTASVLLFHATLLQLCIGGALALLPDYAHVFWLLKVLRGQKIPYDHHATWSHRPIIMIPAVGVACGLLGGEPWMLIGIVCVMGHLLHDYPFGDGYLNWGWLPFGLGAPDRICTNNHDEWLREHWLRHSWKFQTEVGTGIALLVPTLVMTEHPWVADSMLGLLLSLFFSWHYITRRYARACGKNVEA